MKTKRFVKKSNLLPANFPSVIQFDDTGSSLKKKIRAVQYFFLEIFWPQDFFKKNVESVVN